jgi:hypothetical protein
MNKTLSASLIVIAVLVLAGSIFFSGIMYGRAGLYGPSGALVPNGNTRPFAWNNNTYSPSMTLAPGAHLSWRTVPGSAGVGGNSGYGMGPGMMQRGYGWNGRTNSNTTPLTVDQARQAAEKYVQTLNISGLETGEVMIFDNNAYVVIKESKTGVGAFELLVDPVSGVAYPEYGPNMMWNVKYGGLGHDSMMGGYGGMMGGMMGSWNYQYQIPTDVSAEVTVSAEQAVQYAQQYLDANYAGATAANDPTQFYGYYTLDFEKDDKIIGMLSVNGYNGQVFLHTWHGTFIEEAE